MNPSAKPIAFGRDKSQIVRGLAIIFMIMLHCGFDGRFKICVQLFTFLVGYGYAFASHKNIRHGIKRIWHLLSAFWLILLGIFLPIAIIDGGYEPTASNLLENMFGLESNLNWFSWYVYFYIFAMLTMPLFSRIIGSWHIAGPISILIVLYACAFGIHRINGWSDNIWYQAIFDSCIQSTLMIAGYCMANFKLLNIIILNRGGTQSPLLCCREPYCSCSTSVRPTYL